MDVDEFLQWLAENGADPRSYETMRRALTASTPEQLAADEAEEMRGLAALCLILERFEDVGPPALTDADSLFWPKLVAWGWAAGVRRLATAAVLLCDAGCRGEITPLSRSVFEHAVYLTALADRPREVFAAVFADGMRRAKQRAAADPADDDIEPAPFLDSAMRLVFGDEAENHTRLTISGTIRDIGLGRSGVAWYGEMSQVVHPTMFGALRYWVHADQLPEPSDTPHLRHGEVAAELQALTTHVLVTAAALDRIFPELGALARIRGRDDE